MYLCGLFCYLNKYNKPFMTFQMMYTEKRNFKIKCYGGDFDFSFRLKVIIIMINYFSNILTISILLFIRNTIRNFLSIYVLLHLVAYCLIDFYFKENIQCSCSFGDTGRIETFQIQISNVDRNSNDHFVVINIK